MGLSLQLGSFLFGNLWYHPPIHVRSFREEAVVRQKKKATADRPAIDAFALFLEQAGLSKRTVDFYLRDIDRFFEWLRCRQKRAWRWQDLTELALEEFRANLTKKEKLSLSTVNRALHALRKFCYWATERGLLKEDPAASIITPRPPEKSTPPPLSEGEVDSLLEAASLSRHGLGKRNYALLLLAFETGLRGDELVGLSLKDLRLTNRSGTLQVPVLDSPALALSLKASLRRALNRYLATRLDKAPEAPLFTSKRGTRLSHRALQTVIREIARRAKVKEVTPHRIRHTFAARYLAENPDKMWDLADRMGLVSLQPLYRHVNTDE